MSDRNDSKKTGTAYDATALPSPPAVSRVDTLPDDFARFLSRRPHLIGDVIAGRYKLVETLGDGAMGQVFVAENLAIGRRVAIKVLKAELLGDPDFRKRFQQEAMAIAAIEHRNVARFFDLIVGDPTFLVMEYVEGPTLSRELRRQRRLPVTRALSVGIRLAWALDAAHRHGIIHRDIKPANVILAPDSELGEEPKLIDFGLAKLPTVVGAEELTRTGQIVGTPQYMSPEQISNRNIDARSDVYALGCLIYHMIGGQPPFSGGDDVQVLYRQIEEIPTRLRSLDDSIPESVDDVIAKALAKRPDDRFRTMREFAKALAAIDRRKPHGPAASVPTVRGRRPFAAAAIAILLVATAGLAGYWSGRSSGASGLLFVASDPAGATIEMDGNRVAAITPHAISSVAAGKHLIRVSREGRDPVESHITLAGGEHREVRVTLPPASRELEITSVPQGAFVYVDGRLLVGQTPLTAALTQDEFHELLIEKPGFVSMRRAVKPEDHSSVITVELPAETQPVATLWVDCDRVARVFVDGNDSGFETPTLGMRVPAGQHVIEARDGSGVIRASTSVIMPQGATVHTTLSWAETPKR